MPSPTLLEMEVHSNTFFMIFKQNYHKMCFKKRYNVGNGNITYEANDLIILGLPWWRND